MSVLIKGIEVHRGRCWECPCLDGEYGDCNVLKKDVHYISYDDCPLIELPDHGDLIDREEIFMQLRKDFAIIERMASEARAMAKDYLDGEKQGMGKAMIRVYEHEAVIQAERSEE